MDKNVSIVKVDTRHYRTIARENWGLTREQMRGKHVHHRIPRSEGGTNDPSNLYICSAWFHAHVWHNHFYFAEKASAGGKKGGRAGDRQLKREAGRMGGLKGNKEGKREGGRKGGLKGGKQGGKRQSELKLGCHAPGKASEGGKKGGKNTGSQVWESTVDGFRSNSGNVAQHNKRNGWDPDARLRVK